LEGLQTEYEGLPQRTIDPSDLRPKSLCEARYCLKVLCKVWKSTYYLDSHRKGYIVLQVYFECGNKPTVAFLRIYAGANNTPNFYV
jgi:hypothetical protein